MDRAGETGDHGFGAWVRSRRKELWLTQKKLARLVGCAPVTVQKIEEGQRRPSPPLAEALARHLEIEVQDLERFLRAARSAPTAARGLAGPRAGSDGLPVPAHALVGRERELEAIGEALLQATPHLLTLTGPPGVGKTRLAREVAALLCGTFADGAFFVPLAALDDPGQVLPTVNRRLGLSDGGPRAPLERLQRFLRDKNILLTLDNFEHLLDAAADFSGVLESCPRVRVLATSRSALRLSGEREWPLEPLPLPGPDRPPTQSPAVRLFVERVRAFDPGFALEPRNTEAVVDIVTLLDGLPLALELAAVRLRYQRPQELALRLQNDPMGALGEGPRDAPARQQTLHNAITWSYERLEERLQWAFRHLGVFVGGFDAPAARAVGGAEEKDLERLLDASLIRREGARFNLLETLRVYALKRLTERSELEAAQDAHGRHYLQAAQVHEDTDLDWFEAEIGNLRAALRRAISRLEAEPASRLAIRMYWFWETRGYQREGLEWFKAVLALPGVGGLEPELRVEALSAGSTMAWQSGVFELSRAWLSEALAISRAIGHTRWEANLFWEQAKVAFEQGEYEAARLVGETALALSRRLNFPELLLGTLHQQADLSLAVGNLERAAGFAEEGLALCRDHPGSFWETLLLQDLGLLALERGDYGAARAHLSEELRLVLKIEHRLRLCQTLACLAASLSAPGASGAELLRAARLWGAVEAAHEGAGYFWSPAFQERLGRWTERARARVSDREWDLAWASGRAMSLSEAVEYTRDRNAETTPGIPERASRPG